MNKELIEKIRQLAEKEKEQFVVNEIPPQKIEYDFSKVNLKNLSKKQLIRIIYDLKERLDMYETN